jgi:PAS domain S-box-containing protein
MGRQKKTYQELELDLEMARAEIDGLRSQVRITMFQETQANDVATHEATLKDGHTDATRDELVVALQEAQRRILKLSEESQQFQHLVTSVLNYAIFATNVDGIIVSWNPGAERMKLWKAEEIIGRHLRVLYPPDAQANHCPEQHLQLAREQGFYEGEGKRMRKGGDIFDAYVSLAPIFDEFGVHIGFSKVTRELTEQKKMEAQRLQLATLELARVDWERLVAEDKAQALIAAGAHKDQFLGILSHELRTPINAIMAFASVLGDNIPGSLNQMQHRYIRKILSGADVLLALVDDLLDMSRIQAGKFSVSTRPVRFCEVLQQVTEHFRPMLDEKSGHLDIRVPENLPAVMADSKRLEQVLNNLVSNAIKYSPGNCEVEVRACVAGDRLRCEVRDHGIGIFPEDTPKLFQPFEQLDMRRTRKSGGVGLGLSIVKALIEAHGGEVGVESVVGEGSTFWFKLPLAQPVR